MTDASTPPTAVTAHDLQTAASKAPGSSPMIYDSSALFQGSRVIVINHAGENYRLLITRNNRLILQK